MKTFIVKVNDTTCDLDRADLYQNCKFAAKEYLTGPDFAFVDLRKIKEALENDRIDVIAKELEKHFDYLAYEIEDDGVHLKEEDAMKLMLRKLGLLSKFYTDDGDKKAKLLLNFLTK